MTRVTPDIGHHADLDLRRSRGSRQLGKRLRDRQQLDLCDDRRGQEARRKLPDGNRSAAGEGEFRSIEIVNPTSALDDEILFVGGSGGVFRFSGHFQPDTSLVPLRHGTANVSRSRRAGLRETEWNPFDGRRRTGTRRLGAPQRHLVAGRHVDNQWRPRQRNHHAGSNATDSHLLEILEGTTLRSSIPVEQISRIVVNGNQSR